jgi:hypothetical protein
MVNINLHKEDESENKIYESKFWRSGTFFSIVLLLVVSSVYAGQIFYKKKLVADENALVQEINQKRSSLGDSSLAEIKDFDLRLGAVDSNLTQRVYPNDVLAYIETFLMKNVYIDSYNYENQKNEVIIGAVADNFSTVASQLLNFKKSEKFSNVDISDTGRDSDGKITFKITMKLANYANPEGKL